MALQYATLTNNAQLDAIETEIGVSPILKIRTGAPPADCGTADSGTVLASPTLPSDWMSAASGAAKALLGTWQDTSADNAGTAGHFRIYVGPGGTVCKIQGTAGQSVALSTSALTAANGNVLTFVATTGVVVGMNVAGTGIVAGTTVVAVTGTTVTLSKTSTAGVASAAAITFTYDMTLDNAVFAAGQSFSVTAFTITASNT